MSACYSCTKSFSLLNSEKSCGECGYSFCGGCLRQTLVLPKIKSKARVCSNCYDRLTGKVPTRDKSPPSALIRRLEMLDSPLPNTAIIYTNENSKKSKLRRGLSAEDKALCDRLERLHRDPKNVTNTLNDEEILQRLSRLRGDEPSTSKPETFFTKTDKRTLIEQENDIIMGTHDEVRIDRLRPNPDDEIAERLARLRGEEPQVTKIANDVDPELFLKSLKERSSEATSLNLDEECKLFNKIAEEKESEVLSEIKKMKDDKELSVKLSEIQLRQSSMEHEDDSDYEMDSDQVFQKILKGVSLEGPPSECFMCGEISSDEFCSFDSLVFCKKCCQDNQKDCNQMNE